MNKLLSKKEKKKIFFQKIKAKEEEEEEEGNYQPYLYDSLDDPAYFVIISHILKCTEEFGCKVIQLNSTQFNSIQLKKKAKKKLKKKNKYCCLLGNMGCHTIPSSIVPKSNQG